MRADGQTDKHDKPNSRFSQIWKKSIKSNTTAISARVSSRYGPEDPENGFGASKPERRHLQKHLTPVLGTCHIVCKLQSRRKSGDNNCN